MKLKKGDKVTITLGKDRGKSGTIDRVLTKANAVVVTGLNQYKRHLKPRGEGQNKSGGIVSVDRPLILSKVALLCPKCGKPTRVGYKLDGDKKLRFCKKCNATI